MNIVSCLSPSRIWNKYANEFQYVPCGKCSACREKKIFDWTSRLEAECRSWKFTAFVTLTYAPENVPTLTRYGNIFVQSDSVHFDPSRPTILLQENFFLANLSKEERIKNEDWDKLRDSIPVLSSYDVQLFVKRLRKNLKTYISNNYEKATPQDYLVRYYICGEYGETTFYPHFHCLFFFSSDFEAKAFEQVVHKSWTYGIIDFSFVERSASRYVSSYVNSISHLPQVLQQSRVRPFSIFSKCPPIGTLSVLDSEVQRIFFSGSPTMFLEDFAKRSVVSVPLWSYYKNKLFPRLALYDKISSDDRALLYDIYNRYVEERGSRDVGSFVADIDFFYTNKRFNRFYTKRVDYYLSLYESYGIKDKQQFISFVIRWWYLSSRVCHQAAMYGITVRSYSDYIDIYYENVIKYKNHDFWVSSESVSSDFGSSPVLAMDLNFLDTILNVDKFDLSHYEFVLMEGFGIDVDKWFSDDAYDYRLEFMKPYQKLYDDFLLDSENLAKKLVKNKKKNDYLQTCDKLKQLVASF